MTRPLFHLMMGAALCLALLVPTSLPGRAEAQSFDELSRDQQRKFDSLLDKAITAYDKERFDDALSLCAQAAEILPHPATVYLPARIADRRGECQQAVSLYQSLLDGTAAGASEARWLAEYKGAIERNLETLGDCQFLLAVDCAEADKGAILIANGALLGTCPDTIELSTSETQLVLMSSDGAQSSQRVKVKAGHTETVSFKPLPTPVAAAGAGVVKFECDSLSTPAVIFENGSALGSCPSALRLTAGKHTLEALDLDGKRAMLVIDVEADAPEQSLRFAPMYTLALSCDEPQLELSIAHPMLEEPLVGLCSDFTAQPPLLPQGTLSLTAKKE
ncbi:MAG: hypothetical protein RBU37_28175, partial [Myxococcota bacterium]|nr:hypothetical protein [Myxococcota bacterium]